MFICLIACNKKNNSDPVTLIELQKLYSNNDLFKLKTVFQKNSNSLSDKDQLYYSAFINSSFYNPKQANIDFKNLLKNYKPSFKDSILSNIYQIKLFNHINLYEYDKAYDCSNLLIQNYSSVIDSSRLENINNEAKIWSALSKTPKQIVTKKEDCLISLIKDKVGLKNIDVAFPKDTLQFIFDTGANFSVIRKSLAKKLGFKIIESNFYVTAATGQKVKSNIAIANNLKLGNITVEEAVFLIFEDSELSFPQIDYHINGIIGFPVISALKEIRLDRRNQLFIPKVPEFYKFDNFASYSLTPIVAVIHNADTLNFSFDTGASSTTLYAPFYSKYKNTLDSLYSTTNFSSASAGGKVNFTGFNDVSIQLELGGGITQLDSLQLHSSNIGAEKKIVHGNLGQDFIKQFDEMIISFEHSSILFKKSNTDSN